MLSGIGVVRMHLNGQIASRVNELDQDRKIRKALAVRAKYISAMRLNIFRQCQSLLRSLRKIGGTVRMTRQLPALRQDISVVFLMIFFDQSMAAPDIILIAGGKF